MTGPRHPAPRRRDDRGYILAAAVITLTLLAIASALTARVFAELLSASATERLAISHTTAARTARTAVDAWMADPEASVAVTTPAHADHDDYVGVWFTDAAAAGCVPAPNTACWQITAVVVTDTADVLRGGEALQQRAAVGLRVVAGCVAGDVGSCRLDTATERVYERAVFAYYQINYADHTTIAAAFAAVAEALADPDRGSYPADCAPTEDTRPECVTDPALTPDLLQTLTHAWGLRNAKVVFTGSDRLNGSLRYSGPGPVLHCGSPHFERIETRSTAPPQPAAETCTGVPRWVDDNNSQTLWGLNDPNRNLPADAPRWVPLPDELDLPAADIPASGCRLATIDYDHTIDTAARDARRAAADPDCPQPHRDDQPEGQPPQQGHAIIHGDIITSPGTITIRSLTVDGSVTIAAAGDIIVCGDIAATGPNPAGGPNVVALITRGHVVIAPGAANGPCEDPQNPPVTVSAASHSVTLTNVAVLAPNGGIYARRWYLPCSSEGCPTLTINGSVAAKHLGLYGIPDPDAGGADHGWIKQFTYPEDNPNTPNTDESFWLARPPHWPNLPVGEWTRLR